MSEINLTGPRFRFHDALKAKSQNGPDLLAISAAASRLVSSWGASHIAFRKAPLKYCKWDALFFTHCPTCLAPKRQSSGPAFNCSLCPVFFCWTISSKILSKVEKCSSRLWLRKEYETRRPDQMKPGAVRWADCCVYVKDVSITAVSSGICCFIPSLHSKPISTWWSVWRWFPSQWKPIKIVNTPPALWTFKLNSMGNWSASDVMGLRCLKHCKRVCSEHCASESLIIPSGINNMYALHC